jgi:nucleoid-associated protein YgaU
MGIFNFGRDKKKPDFSNVKAGSSTEAPKTQVSAEPSFAEYRVVKGDSLSKIAMRVYGDPQAWRRIYDANKDIIDDPNLIQPGQVLKVPKQGEGGPK